MIICLLFQCKLGNKLSIVYDYGARARVCVCVCVCVCVYVEAIRNLL